jgi:hypothetical protein
MVYMKNKKKQVLILPAPQKVEVLKKRFKEDVDIIRGYFKDIEFRFNCNLRILHKGKDIREYDFVWLASHFNSRDISRAISIYLDHHNISHTKINYGEGTSKLIDITRFELNKIPIPDTFFQKKQEIYEKIDAIEELCGYPLIVKDTKGSRGRNSFYVESRDELIEVVSKLPGNKSFIIQQFIPNDYDWGIIVAEGKVVSAEKSYRPKCEFRNNACRGAKEVFTNIKNVSMKVKEIAQKACEVLNLDWARADIVIDKNTSLPYLLEVNRFPGMTTGSTEEQAFFSYLKNKLGNN